jgi:hypothetical protein
MPQKNYRSVLISDQAFMELRRNSANMRVPQQRFLSDLILLVVEKHPEILAELQESYSAGE